MNARVPAVLARRFPLLPLLRLPPFANVNPNGTSYARVPLRGFTLVAIALRFGGKRFRAIDCRRIILRNSGWIIYEADASIVRMIDLYREGGRTPRRYAFLDFTDPSIGIGGINLRAVRNDLSIEIDVGPDARDPIIDWWGAYSA